MPNKSVNLKTQNILIFFWFLNIFAYYRIGKVRKWLLDSIISTAIAVITFVISGSIGIWLVNEQGFNPDTVNGVSFVITIIDSYVIQSYLASRKVRKWSREWNEKIKSN